MRVAEERPKADRAGDGFVPRELSAVVVGDGASRAGGQTAQLLYKSLRNLKRVDVLPAYQLNAYRVLRSDSLVLTEGALERVGEVFGS